MKVKLLDKKIILVLGILISMFAASVVQNVYYADEMPDTKQISEIFPDPNLAAKVARGLGKQSSDMVSQAELNQVVTLNADSVGIQSLEGIQYLNYLSNLSLRVNAISDISQLNSLTRLTSVNLQQNQITDISALRNLTSLEDVVLSTNKIVDLTPLSSLPTLRSLDISNNAGLSLEPLANTLSLTTLLADNVGLTSIASLQKLQALKTVSLNSNQLTDISILSNLTNLEYVYLNSNAISDISVISALGNLKKLSINLNNVSDITPLRNVLTLQELQISNNPITTIEAVSGLVNLTYLEFNVVGIQDISAVSNLDKLTYLSFNYITNRISDISPVQNLTNLVDLHFNGNAVSDLTPLAKLQKIKTLWMSDNQITELEPIRAIAALKIIYFDQNNVYDISVLTRMNTASLEWINGGSNHITDISPLSSIQNTFTSIIYFKDQRITLDAESVQGTAIELSNVSVDLDGVSPITSYETLYDTSLVSANPILVNGDADGTGQFRWDNLDAGDYHTGYKVSKTENFLFGTLYYSLLVEQDVTVFSPYKVTYDANGATIGLPPVDTMSYFRGNNALVKGLEGLGHETATFVEWNTMPDGTGVGYQESDTISNLQGDVQLFAIWEPDPIVPVIPPKPAVVVPEEDTVLVYAVSKPAIQAGDYTHVDVLYTMISLAALVGLFVKRRKLIGDN